MPLILYKYEITVAENWFCQDSDSIKNFDQVTQRQRFHLKYKMSKNVS